MGISGYNFLHLLSICIQEDDSQFSKDKFGAAGAENNTTEKDGNLPRKNTCIPVPSRKTKIENTQGILCVMVLIMEYSKHQSTSSWLKVQAIWQLVSTLGAQLTRYRILAYQLIDLYMYIVLGRFAVVVFLINLGFHGEILYSNEENLQGFK